MGEETIAAGAGDMPDETQRPPTRPLKRWRVVVRGTAAALVRESARDEAPDGSVRTPAWKALGERRRTA